MGNSQAGFKDYYYYSKSINVKVLTVRSTISQWLPQKSKSKDSGDNYTSGLQYILTQANLKPRNLSFTFWQTPKSLLFLLTSQDK